MQISGNMAGFDHAIMYRQQLNTTRSDKEKPFFGVMPEDETMQHLAETLDRGKKAPYSHLAKDGLINCNGVIFVCNDEKQQLSLGDVNDPSACISVQLSGGGSFVFNRDCIGDLAKAIEMFSPEDVKRIMYAIAQDAKCRETQNEIDEDINSLGEAVEQHQKVEERDCV